MLGQHTGGLHPRFLIGGEGDDQVAVGRISVFLQADKGAGQQRHARLVVHRAAGIEVSVFLDGLVGIAGPCLGGGVDDVHMRDKRDWSLGAAFLAGIANDKTGDLFAVNRHRGNIDLVFGEACGPQPVGKQFGLRPGLSIAFGCADLEDVFQKLAGGLAVGLIHICGRRGIGRRCKGEADGDSRGTGCAYEGCARHDAILPVLAS